MWGWALPLFPEYVAWWNSTNDRRELQRFAQGIVRKSSNWAGLKALGFLCLLPVAPAFALLLASVTVGPQPAMKVGNNVPRRNIRLSGWQRVGIVLSVIWIIGYCVASAVKLPDLYRREYLLVEMRCAAEHYDVDVVGTISRLCGKSPRKSGVACH